MKIFTFVFRPSESAFLCLHTVCGGLFFLAAWYISLLTFEKYIYILLNSLRSIRSNGRSTKNSLIHFLWQLESFVPLLICIQCFGHNDCILFSSIYQLWPSILLMLKKIILTCCLENSHPVDRYPTWALVLCSSSSLLMFLCNSKSQKYRKDVA